MSSLPMVNGGGGRIVFHYLGAYGHNLQYARNTAEDASLVQGYFTLTSGTYTSIQTSYTVQKAFKARFHYAKQSRGDNIANDSLTLNNVSITQWQETELKPNDVITLNCGRRSSFSAITLVIEEI